MQWHSYNRDNDRTMLLQKLATKATLFQVLGKKKDTVSHAAERLSLY